MGNWLKTHFWVSQHDTSSIASSNWLFDHWSVALSADGRLFWYLPNNLPINLTSVAIGLRKWVMPTIWNSCFHAKICNICIIANSAVKTMISESDQNTDHPHENNSDLNSLNPDLVRPFTFLTPSFTCCAKSTHLRADLWYFCSFLSVSRRKKREQNLTFNS